MLHFAAADLGLYCLPISPEKDARLIQGFSFLSEVRAGGLLNLGKYHMEHQSWENLMLSKRTGPPFKID